MEGINWRSSSPGGDSVERETWSGSSGGVH